MQKLNESFLEWLRNLDDGGVLRLVPNFKGTELEALDAFSKGLDSAKKAYSSTNRSWDIEPEFHPPFCLRMTSDPEFRTTSSTMIIDPYLINRFTKPWSKKVNLMFQECVDRVRSKLGETIPIKLGLAGWGNLPSFLQKVIESAFGNQPEIRVCLMDIDFIATVAEGSYLHLVTQGAALQQYARADLGIPDCPWIVEEGADLTNEEQRVVEFCVVVKNPGFPYTFHQSVVMSSPGVDTDTASHMGTDTEVAEKVVTTVGTIDLEIPDAMGFQLQQDRCGNVFMQVGYTVQLHVDRMMPFLVLTETTSGRRLKASFKVKNLYRHFCRDHLVKKAEEKKKPARIHEPRTLGLSSRPKKKIEMQDHRVKKPVVHKSGFSNKDAMKLAALEQVVAEIDDARTDAMELDQTGKTSASHSFATAGSFAFRGKPKLEPTSKAESMELVAAASNDES